MKRILHLTTAALFSASMLATPALAQEGQGDKNADEPSITEPDAGVTVDTDTTAAVDTDFGTALGLVGDADTTAEISAMTDVGTIRVVSFDTITETQEDRGSLQTTLAEREAEIANLQAAIAANSAAAAQLEAEGVATEDVIAAKIAADGTLEVYTR